MLLLAEVVPRSAVAKLRRIVLQPLVFKATSNTVKLPQRSSYYDVEILSAPVQTVG